MPRLRDNFSSVTSKPHFVEIQLPLLHKLHSDNRPEVVGMRMEEFKLRLWLANKPQKAEGKLKQIKKELKSLWTEKLCEEIVFLISSQSANLITKVPKSICTIKEKKLNNEAQAFLFNSNCSVPSSMFMNIADHSYV
jgi:hypothetical protein